MYFINSYFTVAIYLAVITCVICPVLYWHKTLAANSRMKRMMASFGIDEDTIANADLLHEIDTDTLKNRCRNCDVTDTCDRWLDGQVVESPSFCPNFLQFNTAARSSER